MIKDLQFDAANPTNTTADYGQVTKPTAKAFLSKIYLSREMNKEAIDLLNDVIKSYGFMLLPNYADLPNFATNTANSD